MMGLHAFVYAHFMPSGEMLEADSIESPKALLRRRYPNAHFGQWQQGPCSVNWPTVEHYFQAAKFFDTDEEWAEQIRQAATPTKAKSMGRSKLHPLRPDWNRVKDDVMRRAVRAKFETHADLRAVLLGTGDEELVENASRDYYWGCGRDGSDRNTLGKILMEVRDALRCDA